MRYTIQEIESKEKLREETSRLKSILKELIYPSREYINYFLEYFPDWNTKESKDNIRSCWNGQRVNEDVVKMLKIIIDKLKKK